MIKPIDMKRLLFLVIVLLGVMNAWAEEGSKEFKKSFPADAIDELTVTNRYGNIDIKQEGNEFSITTSVWVEAKNKAKVDEILEYISITAKEQGGVLNVETLFQKDMSLRQMFAGVTVSVDYHIKVPKGKKVRLVCTEGGASVADFVGDMSVEIVSGNFKANSVTGGELSVKQNKGEFDVEKLENVIAEFKYCKVKIGEGKDMKLDCTSTTLQLMEANKLSLKTSGGTCYLGMVEDMDGTSFYTKYEVQDIGGSLNMDMRWGELNVRNVNFSFASVNVKGSATKVGLTFMEGCGYTLELTRNKNLKVDLPQGVTLENKPTADKNILFETGFIGNKKYAGKVNLNLSGGSLFIQ